MTSVMAGGMRMCTVAAAAAALALPAGGAAAAGAATVYRGSSHGVTCVLRPEHNGATLTISFGAGSDAILARAAASSFPEAFLIWPVPSSRRSIETASYFAETVLVDRGRREAKLQLYELPKSTGFLCGLHATVPSSGPGGATPFLHSPYVLVRLAPQR